ncbi:LOW QUALITY PROTEIN: uncharacterized protein O3Q21_004950 [Podargus strigoides]
MALHFCSVTPYAIPGVLALHGCWWIYVHRKKYAVYHNKQAIAPEEKQQKQMLENGSSLRTEAHVPQRLPLSSKEECPENETSTSLQSAGSQCPSLLCQALRRPDLSQDLPGLSVTTVQPSTLEDDSGKLEARGSQDEGGVPACVSLPLISKSTECHGSAEVSLIQDSGSRANQDQWSSVSVTLTEKSLGIMERTSNAEQSDVSSMMIKPPRESQTGSVTALCLGLEKEANTPQACLNNEVEVVSSHKYSAVSMLLDSLESACLEQCREEEMTDVCPLSLSISATQDMSAEQSSVPSEKPPTLKLPEDSKVPCSDGILKEDGPDLNHQCSRAPGMDGGHSGGSDADNMDFVDSGCAMRKTVALQNSKLGGESSKSDFIIWEIEVPKELVGHLIGKQGQFLSFLRQASGAKICVATLPYFHDSQDCHFKGSLHQVEVVLSCFPRSRSFTGQQDVTSR